jgi:hypothetical protein
MRRPLIVVSILIALLLGFVAGWVARPHDVAPVTARPEVARSSVAPTTTIGDEHEAWEKVPPTSPHYASAQRLLGWNYYAHDKHDLVEAKRHVDLALKASPDDRMVLEDAGRVYILAGLTAEGTAMLKKADTRQARDFLAKMQGG